MALMCWQRATVLVWICAGKCKPNRLGFLAKPHKTEALCQHIEPYRSSDMWLGVAVEGATEAVVAAMQDLRVRAGVRVQLNAMATCPNDERGS